MKKFIPALIILFSFSIYGQEIIQESDSITVEKIKRLSLGVKAGVPNIASLNGELILPLIGNRI